MLLSHRLLLAGLQQRPQVPSLSFPLPLALPVMMPPAARRPHERIKLISDDQVEAVIPRALAEYSQVLSMLLAEENGFREASCGEIRLVGISGALMQRLVEYLQYRKQYDGTEDHPPWDIDAKEAVDMLLMADYLDV